MEHLSNESKNAIKESIRNHYDVTATDTDIEFVGDTLTKYVYMGFGRTSGVLPSEWKKAKGILDIACTEGIAQPFSLGKGKGKFTTNFSIDTVVNKLLVNPDALNTILSYVDKYYTFGFEQISLEFEL